MIAATKKIPIMATLVAFVAVVIMLRLGFWQLERMEEKQQRLETLTEKLNSGNLSLVNLPDELELAADTPVEFSGLADLQRLIYLDNRIVEGSVGYEVLVPVETNVGWVLVNYGWVQATNSRAKLPDIAIDARNNNFTGNVVVPSMNPMIKETATAMDGFPLLIQQIDIDTISDITGIAFQPFVVALQQAPDSLFKNNWRPVVMPPEKHFGYALQWFGLAIAAIVIYFVALYKRKSS